MSSVKFSAVGDISFGDHPLTVGYGCYSTFKKHEPSFPFQRVAHNFNESDILFGNLECAVSEKVLTAKNYAEAQMLGHPRSIQGLAESGFSVVNFANNHCFQHGTKPFNETLELLEKHNIVACGVHCQDHRSGQVTYIEKNGLTVAFLGYSFRPRQYFTCPPPYSEGDMLRIEQEISAIKAHADCIIVSLHWGIEFVNRPSPEEMKIGRALITAGADLILGHHPHVIRGIEQYKGGVIVYSLGNFVCDMLWDRRLRESMIFSCELTRQGVRAVKCMPIMISENYQPVEMARDEADLFFASFNQLTKNNEEESLSAFARKSEEYNDEANTVLREIRRKSQIYFLFRMFKIPLRIVIQQLCKYFFNRVNELSVKLKIVEH